VRIKKVDANQKEIVAALRNAGWAVALMHRAGEGFPDLVVSRKDWGTFLVEVKVPGEKPNARQLKFYQDWDRAGGEDPLVITSAEMFFEAVGFNINKGE
jgi:Holliday junction resolvase